MTAVLVGEQRSATLTHTLGSAPIDIGSLTLSGDARVIFAVEPSDDGMRLVERDAVTFAVVARDEHPLPPTMSLASASDFIVSSDGRIAVGLNDSHSGVCVIDRRSGDVRSVELAGCSRLHFIMWVIDGALVAVADHREGSFLVDLRDGAVRGPFEGEVIAASGDAIVLRGNSDLNMVAVEDGRELGRWSIDGMRAYRPPCVISRDASGFWCASSNEGAERLAKVWWCEPGRPPHLAGRLDDRAPIAAATRWGDGLALVSSRCDVVIAHVGSTCEMLHFEPREGARGAGVLGAFYAVHAGQLCSLHRRASLVGCTLRGGTS